jgi:hypothetical protein
MQGLLALIAREQRGLIEDLTEIDGRIGAGEIARQYEGARDFFFQLEFDHVNGDAADGLEGKAHFTLAGHARSLSEECASIRARGIGRHRTIARRKKRISPLDATSALRDAVSDEFDFNDGDWRILTAVLPHPRHLLNRQQRHLERAGGQRCVRRAFLVIVVQEWLRFGSDGATKATRACCHPCRSRTAYGRPSW